MRDLGTLRPLYPGQLSALLMYPREQTALEQLWETPYASRTTMLWNAAEDSQGSGHWGDSDDSSSYERFDTFGHSGSGSSGSGTDLKDILPSSERDGTSLVRHASAPSHPARVCFSAGSAHTGST